MLNDNMKINAISVSPPRLENNRWMEGGHTSGYELWRTFASFFFRVGTDILVHFLTYVFAIWLEFSPSLTFWPRQLACAMRACVRHAFDPLRGICFPQYFGITRRYMQKKYIFWVILFFYEKKMIFERVFEFSRPAFGHGRLGHPQSL